MVHAGTPRAVTPAILALCEQLLVEAAPQFLDVSPRGDAQILDCFPVVQQQAEQGGGEVCYGWRFWELPLAYVEAEFHAVWRNPAGDLMDITPTQTGATRILFVADPGRRYEGRQVNNVRRALAINPAVDEFLQAADAEFEFLNRGSRADQHALSLTPHEAAEIQAIRQRRADALVAMIRSLPDPGRNDPCPCGSGAKYKKCCGALG
jgi:hypothetical protein